MNQRFAAPAIVAPRRRALAALLVAVCLLATPLVALAKKGEKNYKRGLEFEAAQQWDRAAQEFALAVATLPSDIEYQLHYRRSIFNASQKFMEQGRTLAERGDYTGAYNAFRQAYGYDPVNELAASEMERMLRLQRQKEGGDPNDGTTGNGNGVPRATSSNNGAGASSQGTPAAYRTDVADNNSGGARVITASAQDAALPLRSEPLRVINYSGDLEAFIRQLATELNLNVIFDSNFPKKTINLNLRDVTTSKALDFIFLSQGLFFQKLDRRTILVADQSKRGQYQQLVLRTFYLQNIDPNDVRTLIQAALPPNSGRTPNITPNKATNSITVRDTPENIRIIEELLRAIDKDRAEVVMEVNIYEVSRTNLLQLGNQIGVEPSSGAANQLTNLGGVSRGLAILAGSRQVAQQAIGASASTALGAAFILPTTALSAFQSKDNTRLLASTQVHAFDTEQSTTRIGQKVPVQTAQLSNFGFNGNNGGGGGGAVNSGLGGFGGGFPVIQYQDTGLILKFTPQVFPNLDVQVKMEIESNDVIGASTALTPTFSQRNVTGMARIPNNRTMMIASVMQDRRSDGRRGLPLLGLIPVLGRLFSTPTKNDTNSDIVITVTPRVLRAPAVTPDDLEQRPSGTLQAPTAESLEAMLVVADREDQLAAARRLPTNPVVQLPAAPATESARAATTTEPLPAFVPAPKQLAGATTSTTATATTNAANVVNVKPGNNGQATPVNTAPGNAFAPGAGANPNAPTSPAPNVAAPPLADNAHAAAPLLSPVNLPDTRQPMKPTTAALETATASAKTATSMPAATSAATITGAINVADSPVLFVMANSGNMRVGDKQRLFVLIKTGTPLDLAAATLHFDPRVLAVRSVTLGNMFANASQAQPSLTQTVDPLGSIVAALAPAAGTQINGMGVLLFIDVEAVSTGESEVGFQTAGVHLLASSSGRTLQPQLSPARLIVAK